MMICSIASSSVKRDISRVSFSIFSLAVFRKLIITMATRVSVASENAVRIVIRVLKSFFCLARSISLCSVTRSNVLNVTLLLLE